MLQIYNEKVNNLTKIIIQIKQVSLINNRTMNRLLTKFQIRNVF